MILVLPFIMKFPSRSHISCSVSFSYLIPSSHSCVSFSHFALSFILIYHSSISFSHHVEISFSHLNITYHSHISLTHLILTVYFQISFSHLILTSHAHISFSHLMLTSHSQISFSLLILSYHSLISFSHIILTSHYCISFSHFILTSNSHISCSNLILTSLFSHIILTCRSHISFLHLVLSTIPIFLLTNFSNFAFQSLFFHQVFNIFIFEVLTNKMRRFGIYTALIALTSGSNPNCNVAVSLKNSTIHIGFFQFSNINIRFFGWGAI